MTPQMDGLLRLMTSTYRPKSARLLAAMWGERDTLTLATLKALQGRGRVRVTAGGWAVVR